MNSISEVTSAGLFIEISNNKLVYGSSYSQNQ